MSTVWLFFLFLEGEGASHVYKKKNSAARRRTTKNVTKKGGLAGEPEEEDLGGEAEICIMQALAKTPIKL